MLKIRFQRVGRKNDPAFRIAVTERRSKPKSGGIEIVGSFHPKTKETRLDAERIRYWLSQGAQASPRVHNLLVSKSVIRGAKIAVGPKAKAVPAAAETEPPTAATASAPAAEGSSPEVPPGAGPEAAPMVEAAGAKTPQGADVSVGSTNSAAAGRAVSG